VWWVEAWACVFAGALSGRARRLTMKKINKMRLWFCQRFIPLLMELLHSRGIHAGLVVMPCVSGESG